MVEDILKENYVVIDVETTGLNTKKDEIIAFAAIPIKEMKIHMDESYFTLIKPERFRITSIKYHGITENDLLSAPEFYEVAEKIENALISSVVVGYAVNIDVEFLRNAFKKKLRKKLKIRGYLDIAEIEHWLIKRRGRAVNFKLDFDSLLKIYRIEKFSRHSAMGDAFATAYIFLKQLSQLQELDVSPEDLTRFGKKIVFF